MDLTSFFPKEFVIKEVVMDHENINIEIISSKNICKCPICNTESSKIHSQYKRFLYDLNMIDKTVKLFLTSRKFFCCNPLCHRSIFTERFNSLITPYARRTTRLNEKLSKLAFSMSCEAASKLSKYITVSLSADTFLRIINKEKIIINSEYKHIGVDDFAFRKGCSYGTIICDLDTHKPIDILKDRATKTLSDWLKNHTGIEIITRDRANSYSRAIDDTIPETTQIADKWHLLRNMCDILSDILKSNFTKGVTIENTINEVLPSDISIKQTKSEVAREKFQIEKRKILEETKRLYESGVKQKDIMKLLGISKKTVYRYLRRTEPPYYSVKSRGSSLVKHANMIEESFNNKLKSNEILELIRKVEYDGSESLLRMHLSKLKKEKKLKQSNVSANKQRLIKREKLQKLFWRMYEKLKDKDKDLLNEVLCVSEELSKIYQSIQSFRAVFDKKVEGSLETWLENNINSEIQHIKKFASKLKKDIDAVSNSLKYNYTNGLIEGQVNRLKTIKRMMYGRAGFAILKQRVLYQF